MLFSLTPENLIRDFGLNTLCGRGMITALYDALLGASPQTQAPLLKAWLGDTGRLEELGARAQAREKRALKELAAGLGLKYEDLEQEFLLISLHTYFSILIKMLAAPLVGFTYPDTGVPGVEGMWNWVGAVENNRIFALADDLEGATSPWYLQTWTRDLAGALDFLLNILQDYDFSPAGLPPGDIIQHFYHSLLPSALRHGLGEYYTPGWLVEYLYSLLEPDIISLAAGNEGGLLDPTCGSGAFLLPALKALGKKARALGIGAREILGLASRQVVGVDRNPLAVLSARVNYLMTVAHLTLSDDMEAFVPPIYLGDTILAPPPQLRERTFAHIIGNPPWINWETLPISYRQETYSLWEEYGLYQHRGYEALLGKSKDDLAILLTYVVLNRYLAPKGTLAFVITQSIFKTTGAGRGFRSFVLPAGTPVRIMQVEDLSDIRPFPGAKNRTALMVLRKGEDTTYPVPYVYWQFRPGKGPLGAEDSIVQAKEATRRLPLLGQPFDPNDVTSPWLTACPKALKALEKLIAPSYYRAREGVNTGGANGVFYLHLPEEVTGDDKTLTVRNLTAGIKRPVPEVTARLEGALIYPLLRGRDIRPWKAEPQSYILLTHREGEGLRAIPEQELKDKYPRVAQYLAEFAPILDQRRTRVVRNLMATGPFYSVFGIGDYTFAPYKVVWQRIGSKLTAAVVSRKKVSLPIQDLVIPNDSTVFVPFEQEEEAHYFCTLLNSTPAQFVIRSTSVLATGSFASPHILDKIAISQYNLRDPLHEDLSALGQKAAVRASLGEGTGDLEEEMNELVSHLWSLSREERKQIKLSLQQYRN